MIRKITSLQIKAGQQLQARTSLGGLKTAAGSVWLHSQMERRVSVSEG